MRQLTIKQQITRRDEDSFARYLRDISKESQLTVEEETVLTTKAAEGDKQAKDLLIKGNLRFVVSVAKQYQHCGVPLSDLISAGNLGLIKAADKFDPTRGFKFISYAVWWIRQCITTSINEHLKIIRLPANCEAAINEYNDIKNKLEKELGREPSTEEVIENLSSETRKNRRELYTTIYKPLSLDVPMGEDGDLTLYDIIPNESSLQDTLKLEKSMQKDRILKMLKKLSPLEAQIVNLRFGLDGEGVRSYDEIGTIVNLTGERIRQIQQKALRRLRSKEMKSIFNDYVNV